MLWRLWTAFAGAPLGLLAALAVLAEPSVWALEASAAAGAGLLAVLLSLVARQRDDDPARGLHLAWGAAPGFAALPAAALVWLGLPPGPWIGLGLCATALAAGVAWGALATGPRSWAAVTGAAAGAFAGGAVLLAAVSALVAGLGAPGPLRTEALAHAIYDLDARTPTRALPGCSQRVRGARVIADAGAHPRLGPRGEHVWFDAPDAEGRRQVYRLERASGTRVCWTCGQPGNNARPAPDPQGRAVVFDGDRHADLRRPANTELFRMRADGDEPAAHARRLTYWPGPDDHAVLGPSARSVVWSRRGPRGYFVASASLRTGHGGMLLGDPGVLFAGGAAWTAPLAWSPDARTLVVARGNPFRGVAILGLDPATGETLALTDRAPGLAPAGTSADGGWLAVATGERLHVAGVLPSALGILLGPWATRQDLSAPLFRSEGLVAGAAGERLRPVSLAPPLRGLWSWGAPTGVALGPDGRTAVIGQRRERGGGGVEERLVELELACPAPGDSG